MKNCKYVPIHVPDIIAVDPKNYGILVRLNLVKH